MEYFDVASCKHVDFISARDRIGEKTYLEEVTIDGNNGFLCLIKGEVEGQLLPIAWVETKGAGDVFSLGEKTREPKIDASRKARVWPDMSGLLGMAMTCWGCKMRQDASGLLVPRWELSRKGEEMVGCHVPPWKGKSALLRWRKCALSVLKWDKRNAWGFYARIPSFMSLRSQVL